MFKLLSLKLINHPFFDDIDFHFVNEGEEKHGPYITLVIGPNGIGKSQLLRVILDIFNNLSTSQGSNYLVKNFTYKFDISYIINEELVTIKSQSLEEVISSDQAEPDDIYYPKSNIIKFRKNNIPCSFEEVPIPSKFIAVSSILSDKFPYLNEDSRMKNNRYEYLGIRTASNNAYVRYNNKKVVSNLISCLKENVYINKFDILFQTLGLEDKVQVLYKKGTHYKKILDILSIKGSILVDEIYKIFQNIIEESDLKDSKNNRDIKYKRIIKDGEKINDITYFLNTYKEYFISEENFTLIIDFKTNEVSLLGYRPVLKNEAEYLNWLVDLEILTHDTIRLTKKLLENKPYYLEQSSSGEYYLLTAFINILSVIKDNSIVVIDEPEISLHPNWQMQYISLLYNIFKSFESVHFVICSHSHLMVSDLIAKKSAILSMIKNVDRSHIECELLSYDTQGWSPENILYRIFGVSTTRNFYFEKDVQDILSMMANHSDDLQKMREIVIRLRRFNLTSNDPLKLVIDKVENYLSKNGN